MPAKTLDIILPCYNPPVDWAQRLPAACADVAAQLGSGTRITLTLVNDGSKQGISSSDVDWLQTHWPDFKYLQYETNQGKGHALRQGITAAQGDFQIYTDIDFPYTTESLVAVYRALAAQGADIAAGVRDAEYYQHVPPMRRFISKFLRWLLRNFLRIQIADTQCGLKGFNARGRAVFLQTKIKRFLFDLEFIFLASSNEEVRLLPVPVQLRPGIEFSKARMGILIRESINFGSIFFKGIGRRLFSRS